ncbi:MAG: hypothetical protein H7282_04960 [Cytophagaceae bacterium]|nr:hypothetical protein [Cytophagaceae bacterium]
MASDAVGLERVSRVVGYKLQKGNFSEVTPNLPQSIAVLGEANEANQAALDLTPWVFTSLQQAGIRYGFGSPIYSSLRILKPNSGRGSGGIPITVYPQAKAGGSVAKILYVTPTGTATGNTTHTVVLAGRYGLDGDTYDFTVNTGDTPAVICGKISSAVNSILGAPAIGTATSTEAVLTAKWKGLTSQDLVVSIDTNGNDAGVTYAVTQNTAGAGTPTIGTSLSLFGNTWHTQVVNTYGAVPSIMTALETFNGIPDPTAPTGRYQATIVKPFIALTGSVLDDPSSLTDGRLNDVTIAICPAPLSKGLPYEAAANMCVLFARQAQDTPHLDVEGKSYPDMPTPKTIGSMSTYDFRDQIVQKGCSTVELVGGKYMVDDFVTTYHPLGENPPQYRYCRILNIDFNIRFAYYLKEEINVKDHVIANDDDIVTASKVVKPKQWKQVLNNLFEELESRALIVDSGFSSASLTVSIGTVNPDRLETFFKYKRSGVVRISSTTAEAGFNTGSLQN